MADITHRRMIDCILDLLHILHNLLDPLHSFPVRLARFGNEAVEPLLSWSSRRSHQVEAGLRFRTDCCEAISFICQGSPPLNYAMAAAAGDKHSIVRTAARLVTLSSTKALKVSCL